MFFKLKNEIYCCSGSEKEVNVLFVMESPFADELNAGYPCAGNTGIVMSKALALGIAPFGKLLFSGMEKRFAIFNTFNFALDSRVCVELTGKYHPKEVYNFWDQYDIPWCGLKIQDKSIGCELTIKKIWSGSYDRKAHYESLWNYISCIDENIRNVFFEKYTSILRPVIEGTKFPNIKEIVVCGFIAQSVFTVAFEKKVFPYNTPLSIKNCSVPVRFLNYPSGSLQNHQEWSYSLP